jgi:hypothetical protein
MRVVRVALVGLLGGLAIVGCGKKGPPLPPLVRFAAAPGDVVAERRGEIVHIRFVVPSANNDGSRPANVERVEIVGLTGPPGLSVDQVLRDGARVAAVVVNPPPDLDAAPGDRPSPPGSGVDQGAPAAVVDGLAPMSPGTGADADTVRAYVVVAIGARGRRGQPSGRVVVPLGPAPTSPSRPTLTYDEDGVVVTWTPPASGALAGFADSAYHVYEVSEAGPGDTSGPTETRLNDEPSLDARFVDERVEWGVERCFAVSTVAAVSGLRIESAVSPPACVTPIDTFPPDAPGGVGALGSAGGISVYWEASDADDLAGYLVLRSVAPAAPATPITPAPIQELSFRDQVTPGTRFAYAVVAVDRAGNLSPLSEIVEETAR